MLSDFVMNLALEQTVKAWKRDDFPTIILSLAVIALCLDAKSRQR